MSQSEQQIERRYKSLPPPPDGYGPWHAHRPTVGSLGPPIGITGISRTVVLVEGDFIGDTVRLTGSWNMGEARQYDWSSDEYMPDTQVIAFFALPEDHPYNHCIPEPMKPMLDMAGMDECSLWGTF